MKNVDMKWPILLIAFNCFPFQNHGHPHTAAYTQGSQTQAEVVAGHFVEESYYYSPTPTRANGSAR